jgi:replicative DNA helicase
VIAHAKNEPGAKALFSPECERSLLNRLLNTASDSDVQTEVMERLDSSDFGDDRHATIYTAAKDLRAEGAPVEFEAVLEHLKRENALGLAGGVPYLADLLDATPTLNPAYHAGVIQGYALRRKLRDALMKGVVLTEALEQDLDEIAHEVERMVLLAGERKGEADSLREMGTYLAAFVDAMESTETGLTWGLADLDEITRGLRKQRLYTIMARPSMGKSAFVQGVALNAAIHESKRVAFFSVENGEEEWMEAAFAWAGGFDMHTFRLILASARPDLAHGAVEFAKAMEALKDARSRLFLDTQSRTVAQILRRARRLKRQGGLDLIVTDHMHEMDGAGENEERKVAKIARDHKAMAKELDVPVVSAGQLNRKCEDRPDKRPHPSDGRASGGIEEASDTIGLLYRPEYYFGHEIAIPKDQGGGKRNVEGYAEWIIGKNRGGPRQHHGRDHLKMFFRAQAVRFESYAAWRNQ